MDFYNRISILVDNFFSGLTVQDKVVSVVFLKIGNYDILCLFIKTSRLINTLFTQS